MKKFMLSLVLLFALSVSAQACAGYAAGFYAPLVVPVVAQSYVVPVAPIVAQTYTAPVVSPVVSGYTSSVVSGYGSYGVSALVGDYAFRGYRSRFVAVVPTSRAVVVRSGFRGRAAVVNVRGGGRTVVRVRR